MLLLFQSIIVTKFCNVSMYQSQIQMQNHIKIDFFNIVISCNFNCKLNAIILLLILYCDVFIDVQFLGIKAILCNILMHVLIDILYYFIIYFQLDSH